MNSLESDSDFESSGDLACERDRLGPNGVGVRLDGDSSELRRQRRNPDKILRWDGSLVEEIARVVKLESIRNRVVEPLKHALQLRGQRTGWCWTVDRPSPQVAERA